MNERSDTQVFDAFGEPMAAPRVSNFTTGERRKYAAAVAVFWSLALILAVGRVHFAPVLDAAPIALASR